MIVSEVMTTKLVTVAPDDTLSHAANLLRQYQFHHLPVVKDSSDVKTFEPNHSSRKTLLLEGLLTSQDIELAASSGKWSSRELIIPLPPGDLTPLARTLLLAAELHIHVRSAIAAPLQTGMPLEATVRLGTIFPTPLLARLQEEHIQYTFADLQTEEDKHV